MKVLSTNKLIADCFCAGDVVGATRHIDIYLCILIFCVLDDPRYRLS